MRWMLLLAFVALLSACKGDKKTVLVIESYSADFYWAASYEKGLKEKLGDRYDLHFFYMDTKRLPKEVHQQMADKALQEVEQLDPDIVVLGDDAALKYTGPRLALKEDLPVVFLGINNNPTFYFPKWPKNVTGVLERPPLRDSVMTIKTVMPNAKRIAVLFDTDLTAQVVKSDLFVGRDSIVINDMTIDIRTIESFPMWQVFVNQAQKNNYDAFIMGLYHNLKDDKSGIANPEEVAIWTSQHSPIPLFAFWDFAVGPEKGLGGLIVSGLEQGRVAGDLVEQIAAGAKVSDIMPVVGGNGELMFSKKQLDRFHLTLPPEISQKVHFVD